MSLAAISPVAEPATVAQKPAPAAPVASKPVTEPPPQDTVTLSAAAHKASADADHDGDSR